jgi:hypothetical protein
MSYSPFFDLLHDDSAPVGDFGDGVHYSVLRVPIWQDGLLKPLPKARLLDFAVIWDEDHDARVIEGVEALYFQGLLAPVMFVGERKGSLSIILDAEAVKGWNEAMWRRYRTAVNEIGPGDDPWPATVQVGLAEKNTIVHASAADVATYLGNIDLLWRLGSKPVGEHVPKNVIERAADEFISFTTSVRHVS